MKGRYSSFLTAAYVYVGTGRYITNELYIGAYVTRRRATKAERKRERKKKKKRETEGKRSKYE